MLYIYQWAEKMKMFRKKFNNFKAFRLFCPAPFMFLKNVGFLIFIFTVGRAGHVEHSQFKNAIA
jgi:hypothetical protein